MTRLEVPLAQGWNLLRSLLGDHLHPGGAALSEKLLDVANPPPDGVLVDLGSGRGETLRLAKKRWPGLRALGVDPQASPAGAKNDVVIVRGSATDIPHPTSYAHSIISECALCLAGSWPQALAETRRVLRPEGRLVFSDFYAEGPIPAVPPSVGALVCLENARSANDLLTLLEKAGFSSVRLQDESGSLWELEARVQGRIDARGLLAHLAATSADPEWKPVHAFLEASIKARDDGALRYGIFSATR